MGLGLIQSTGRLLGGQGAAKRPHAVGDGAAETEEFCADHRGVDWVEIPRNLGEAPAQVGG